MPARAVARQALLDAAVGAQRKGDWRELERIARETIALCEPDADAQGLALGHYYLGLSYFLRNDGENAKACYQRTLEIATAANDRAGILRAKVGLSAIAGEMDLDVAKLRYLSEETLLMARELGEEKTVAVSLGNLAEACHLQGDYAPAIRYAGEAAAVFLGLERWSSAGAQYATIAHVHALRREFRQAFENMRRAWEYLGREPVAFHRAWYFQVWFLIAAALGRWETAARLYGFVGHYRDVNGAPRLQGMLPRMSEPIERQYKKLGRERAVELAAEGEAYSIEQAQELAESLRSAS